MGVREELCNEFKSFLPDKIFDAHTHVSYASKEVSDGGELKKGEAFGVNKLLEWDADLYPGREMTYFLIGMPLRRIDIYRMADYVVEESRRYKGAYPVIVVKPGMNEKKLEKYIEERGIVGLKPYRYYSVTGDINECEITDFLPESIIKIANRYGLLIVLHLSKRKGILDKKNRYNLERLSEKYPNVKWQLAHCARAFNPYFLEGVIESFSSLNNVYFDTSAVCESDVFDILFSNIDISRILFGSDNMPLHIKGGKYVSYGHAWVFLSSESCDLNLPYCDATPLPVVYEELRALKRSINRIFGFDKGRVMEVIGKVFYQNAKNLIESIIRTIS